MSIPLVSRFPAVFAVLALILVVAICKPLVIYFTDKKGFRKYPNQNWLSGFTNLARCWEIGRPHHHIHSKRLHDAHREQPIIRVGPNWLSFGRSPAARDIYGYESKCRKGAAYDKLAEGGAHLNNISNKPEHIARRRMVASYYAPRNIEDWEPRVAASMVNFRCRIDDWCTLPGNPQQEFETTFDGVRWIFLFSMEAIIKIGLSKDVAFLEHGNDHIEVGDADGTLRAVSVIHSVHAVGRAGATVLWDTENLSWWISLTTRLSKKYASNWLCGADWHAAMETLVRERMERYSNGEILNDLFQPMMEGARGNKADISIKDRIGEVEQMGKCQRVQPQPR